MASRNDSAPGSVIEVGGVLLLAACILLSLSLLSYDWRDIHLLQSPSQAPPANFVGPTGAWTGYVLFNLMGVGAYLLPLWCLWLGLYIVFFARSRRKLLAAALWSLLGIWLITAWFELISPWLEGISRYLNIYPAAGGVIMKGLIQAMQNVFGVWGTRVLTAAALAATLVGLFGLRSLNDGLKRLTVMCWRGGVNLCSILNRGMKQVSRYRHRYEPTSTVASTLARAKPRYGSRPHSPDPLPEPPPAAPDPPPSPISAERRDAAVKKQPPAPRKVAAREHPAGGNISSSGDYRLPGLDLLNPLPSGRQRTLESDTGTTAEVIKKTLAEFNIACEITNVEQGPVVTRYELFPAPGVRVERIGGLSNNLALSLKATSVRVQAPIPGKGVVGIEVPNARASKVFLRQIIESETWQRSKSGLPLVLGQDVGGNDMLADLTSMPHLLIAGATGSGKTVCLNTILTGLLMSKRPDELRLLLIDPKMVEFSIYNSLPHLVVPIITDPRKVSIALRWAINEMEQRYKKFAKAGVRNIAGYNNRPIERQIELFDEPQTQNPAAKEPERMPYIVIIIDELADLMLIAQAEIENSIARLAQLSRAVGIHIIIATQRPSVNVITGTIKANFPGRIAFQVAQKVDSRTILDANGADKLLGRGDMLFLPPGSSKLVRAQGAMAADEEIERIVTWAGKQAEPSYEQGIHEKIINARTDADENNGSSDNGDEDGELVEAAIRIIRETHRASTSSLQRRLRIGYTRAARIMDLLEERGMIGPPRGSDPREILIDLNGEIPHNPNDSVRDDAKGDDEL